MHSRLLCTGLLLAFAIGCTLSSSPGRTKIVYKVNEHSLSATEFADKLATKLKDYDSVQIKDPEVLKSVKGQILHEFLNDKLAEDWAEKNGLSVSSEELGAAVDAYRKQYPNDLAMKQALAESGQSFETWKNSLRPLLLQKKIFESLKPKIAQPTDEEAASYYEMNKEQFRKPSFIRIRQVVLDKKDDAERLAATMTRNTSLADMARKFSIAPEARNGGETDWIPKGSVEIFDQAFSWPIGKRSSVLKSPYGYHIFEVIAKQPESQLSFAQAKDTILALMRADREQAAFAAWLEEQIKASTVMKNEALINSVSVTTRGAN